MITFPVSRSVRPAFRHVVSGRSARQFLTPLDRLTSGQGPLLRIDRGLCQPYDGGLSLPHYVFLGPPGGGETIRLGLFATLHGDEPESGLGLIRFLRQLLVRPELAKGFLIHAFPLCNPTGYEDGTRHARAGKDLNREFWRDSREPEVRFLEGQIRRHQFHGLVSLHCDDTSHGLYGFLSGWRTGDVLSAGLLEPALAAAERLLPRNMEPVIDHFPACNGVLDRCYDGVLRSPVGLEHTPFEITFETPGLAPAHLQAEAFNAALLAILDRYRQLIAHAASL